MKRGAIFFGIYDHTTVLYHVKNENTTALVPEGGRRHKRLVLRRDSCPISAGLRITSLISVLPRRRSVKGTTTCRWYLSVVSRASIGVRPRKGNAAHILIGTGKSI